MNTLVSLVMGAGYANRILNDRQLVRILGGSDDRRYGQVKRALKSGDLIRVKRGYYALSESHRTNPVHPYALAQALVAGSYISMETALAFHGWIPEAVYTIVSVTPGRKSQQVDHEHFGRFEFNPLALHKSGFLSGVERQVLSGQPALIASPSRALMDIVAYRKQNWAGMSWVEKGLRIERSNLLKLSGADFETLETVYKHKTANKFLTDFKAAIFELESKSSSILTLGAA